MENPWSQIQGHLSIMALSFPAGPSKRCPDIPDCLYKIYSISGAGSQAYPRILSHLRKQAVYYPDVYRGPKPPAFCSQYLVSVSQATHSVQRILESWDFLFEIHENIRKLFFTESVVVSCIVSSRFLHKTTTLHSTLFYCIISILFYSILFYSILFQ